MHPKAAKQMSTAGQLELTDAIIAIPSMCVDTRQPVTGPPNPPDKVVGRKAREKEGSLLCSLR